MSEPASINAPAIEMEQAPARETTVRGQLLWASIFSLGIFILLSILMITAVFRQLTLTLVLQRNTAIVQAAASELSKAIQGGDASPNLATILQPFLAGNAGSFYQVNSNGEPVAGTNQGTANLALEKTLLTDFSQPPIPESHLGQSPSSGDQVIISTARLPGKAGSLILVEPWENVTAPGFYYQAILIALLILGALFSLYTLSLSIGRVTHPITELVETAHRAIPGSIFRPMPEQGPAELRTLIKAFNQMVVQLAEQQTSLRQYAHKALLSQEEERERLSHELHDGTMQDLVGLVQRVELCRSEMDQDPLLARRRLDELQGLLEATLGDVRRISNALRPSILEDLGLPAALQALCNDLERQMPSIHCRCAVTGQERRLAPDLELAVFRVVQEALSNIRKHARQATGVEVELVFQEAGIEALVRNDGPAFPSPDVRDLVRGGHLGLAGMYERARLFHGELSLASDPSTGTTVRLRLPCPPEPAGA
jgi:signal transduction histidine kinase